MTNYIEKEKLLRKKSQESLPCWGSKYIGSKTISQIGCTTTAIAMVYSYNTSTTVYSDSMVSKLKYVNNDLYWSSISNV